MDKHSGRSVEMEKRARDVIWEEGERGRKKLPLQAHTQTLQFQKARTTVTEATTWTASRGHERTAKERG